MNKTQSEVVYCGCGRSFENEAAHLGHQKLQGAKNIHNHQSSKFPPKPFDPRDKMFTIWAWDRLTNDTGSSILIHAGFYISLEQVLSGNQEPNPILQQRGTYKRQYLIEYFFPIISKQYPEFLRTTNDKAAEILVNDWDETLDPHQVALVVQEYRRRHIEA